MGTSDSWGDSDGTQKENFPSENNQPLEYCPQGSGGSPNTGSF